MTSDAGPPVWRALPEPTKRPAPMAPPRQTELSAFCHKCRWQQTRGLIIVPIAIICMCLDFRSRDKAPDLLTTPTSSSTFSEP